MLACTSYFTYYLVACDIYWHAVVLTVMHATYSPQLPDHKSLKLAVRRGISVNMYHLGSMMRANLSASKFGSHHGKQGMQLIVLKFLRPWFHSSFIRTHVSLGH